jgi:hypothetical protein
MGQQEDGFNILTRFVIVEKHINCKYYTPRFDLSGNKIPIFDIWSSGIYVHPGIYTREIDITLPEVKLISYDLVASPGFSFRIETEKTLSLSDGYEKYTDTS